MTTRRSFIQAVMALPFVRGHHGSSGALSSDLGDTQKKPDALVPMAILTEEGLVAWSMNMPTRIEIDGEAVKAFAMLPAKYSNLSSDVVTIDRFAAQVNLMGSNVLRVGHFSRVIVKPTGSATLNWLDGPYLVLQA